MNQQSLIKAVDNSIEELCSKFRSIPTFFYTENDVVCYFSSILQKKLPIYHDKNGIKHFLIHREYPTPFRCDMRENKFEIKNDDARTKRGRKFRRGHYDIVVLNPDFISQHSYEVIKSQDYKLYKKEVISKFNIYKPVVLYCIEFIFNRDSLKSIKGRPKKGTLTGFIAKIRQDTKKLVDSQREYKGFVKKVKMIVLIRECSHEIRSLIKNKIEKFEWKDKIITCFGD